MNGMGQWAHRDGKVDESEHVSDDDRKRGGKDMSIYTAYYGIYVIIDVNTDQHSSSEAMKHWYMLYVQ